MERVVCERELETEQNCNILTPIVLAITAFLSRFPGLLNHVSGGAAFLGHVLIPASSPQLVWSPKLINGGPEGSLCWVLTFSTASCLQLIWSPNYNCSIGGLRAHSAGCWLSLPHLVSNWLNFLCTDLYNSSAPTFFL